VLSQNRNRIFLPAGNLRISGVGQLESIQTQMSMGQVMFCIAVALLGFQVILWTLILGSALTSRPFLPRFPYNLASEIRFLHTSSGISDVAGTADLSSAIEGADSGTGNVVVPVLAVDQIGTQEVSPVEVGTSVRAVTGPVSRSMVTIAAAVGEDDIELVV